MRKLTTKWFKKWAKKVGLAPESLLKAINELEKGLAVADLGHHLFKVRIKREHGGKSSGFRTIILYKSGDRVIFLFGFGKNEKDNIDNSELQYFKKLGDDLLSLSPMEIEEAITKKVLYDLGGKE